MSVEKAFLVEEEPVDLGRDSGRDPRPNKMLVASVDGDFKVLYLQGNGLAVAEELGGIHNYMGSLPPPDGLLVWEGEWSWEEDPEESLLTGTWRPVTKEEWVSYLKGEYVWDVWEKEEHVKLGSENLDKVASEATFLDDHQEDNSSDSSLYLYAVTVIVPGSSLLECVCTSFERAKEIITTNEGDLQERWASFAIIEKFPANSLYSFPFQFWYVWVENDWKSQNVKPTKYGDFKPIKTPEEFRSDIVSSIF